eukprot:9622474-Lingulodinium_polyedra.AAC.1
MAFSVCGSKSSGASRTRSWRMIGSGGRSSPTRCSARSTSSRRSPTRTWARREPWRTSREGHRGNGTGPRRTSPSCPCRRSRAQRRRRGA